VCSRTPVLQDLNQIQFLCYKCANALHDGVSYRYGNAQWLAALVSCQQLCFLPAALVSGVHVLQPLHCFQALLPLLGSQARTCLPENLPRPGTNGSRGEKGLTGHEDARHIKRREGPERRREREAHGRAWADCRWCLGRLNPCSGGLATDRGVHSTSWVGWPGAAPKHALPCPSVPFPRGSRAQLPTLC